MKTKDTCKICGAGIYINSETTPKRGDLWWHDYRQLDYRHQAEPKEYEKVAPPHLTS